MVRGRNSRMNLRQFFNYNHVVVQSLIPEMWVLWKLYNDMEIVVQPSHSCC